MFRRFTFAFMFTFAFSFGGQIAAFAEGAGDKPFEMAAEGGVLLPSHIYRAKEVLKGVDVRVGLPTPKGLFELDGFFANTEGISYRIVSLDYRYDLSLADLPAFVLFGVHGDFWVPAAPYDSLQYAAGWHFGGGFKQELFGGWSAREDFRYRLGPGQSMLIGLGLSYQFSN